MQYNLNLWGRYHVPQNVFLVTARSELRKVLFWALSVIFILFVYEISREPLNGFAPNSHGRRVWSLARMSLNVKVKGQGHEGQISSPLKMHCNALAANNVMQQKG